MESSSQRLSDLVSRDRLIGVRHLISQANLFQIWALVTQAVILYYLSFLSNLFLSWVFLLGTGFLATGLVSLVLSLSRDPTAQQLWISLTLTKLSLAIGTATVIATLLFAGDALDYVFFLPGPLLMLFTFFARRVVEREVVLRKRRGAKAGEYGNLGGMAVELNPYGIDPSTRFQWKEALGWLGFLEVLTISGIFRANARSSNQLPLDSPVFWRWFLEAVVITAAIGIIVGTALAETRKEWNMAVTGRVKLDALDKSRLWFYGGNEAFYCFKLFDRPMNTVMDDHSIVVAHWPASFHVRTSSSGDFQILLSVLQDNANYGTDGRKVSSRA